MNDLAGPSLKQADRRTERGATTVEYAVITILIVLAVTATVMFMADPNDQNSLLPRTYTTVGEKIGNFGLTNIVTN